MTLRTLGSRDIASRLSRLSGLKNASSAKKINALVNAGFKEAAAKAIVNKGGAWNASALTKTALSLADGGGTRLGVKSKGKRDGYLTTREASRLFSVTPKKSTTSNTITSSQDTSATTSTKTSTVTNGAEKDLKNAQTTYNGMNSRASALTQMAIKYRLTNSGDYAALKKAINTAQSLKERTDRLASPQDYAKNIYYASQILSNAISAYEGSYDMGKIIQQQNALRQQMPSMQARK